RQVEVQPRLLAVRDHVQPRRDLVVDRRDHRVFLKLSPVRVAELVQVCARKLQPAWKRVAADDGRPQGSFFHGDWLPTTTYPLTDQPASTVSTSPVITRAASLSRNRAARATSSASIRSSQRGCLVFIRSRMSGFSWARRLMGVRINAGAMTFTRILCG